MLFYGDLNGYVRKCCYDDEQDVRRREDKDGRREDGHVHMSRLSDLHRLRQKSSGTPFLHPRHELRLHLPGGGLSMSGVPSGCGYGAVKQFLLHQGLRGSPALDKRADGQEVMPPAPFLSVLK